MSLSDLGKNDISAEVQGFKDRLASQGMFNGIVAPSSTLAHDLPDAENAALRNLLMKREAELNEIKLSLNETVYKVKYFTTFGSISSYSRSSAKRLIMPYNLKEILQVAMQNLRENEYQGTMQSPHWHARRRSSKYRNVPPRSWKLP